MSKTQHALENLHEHNSQGCGHDHHQEDESGHNDNSACGCGHEHYHKGESGHDHDAACGCGHDHHVPGHADDCQCELCHPHEEYCDVCGESLENCICRMPDADCIKRVYALKNLGCANCAAKMEYKIKELPGVEYASVSFVTKQLRLSAKNHEVLLPAIREICASIESDVEVVPRSGMMPFNFESKVYLLENLGCANCAAKMEKAINDLPDVSAATITYATKQLRLTAKNHAQLLPQVQAICSTIEAGVKVVERIGKPVLAENINQRKKSGGILSMSDEQRSLAEIVFGGILFIISEIAGLVPEAYHIYCLVAAYILLGGRIVLTALKNSTKGQVFDENFLMTIATLGAFAIGSLEEAVAVMLFYQIGELFNDYAVNKSRKSITDLMDINPEYANLLRDGEEEQVDPYEVEIGDTIVIRPGEKVPLDGIVLEGSSTLDTKALTGESVPVEVEAGENIVSGSINLTGLLKVQTTRLFDDSTVAKILELVENASSRKAKAEAFITRFARVYTPAVVILAAMLAVVPPLILGGWSTWIYRACSFLVVSCPCALVISVPLSFFGGLGAASRHGILMKGSNYLEAMGSLDTAVFDKTGTLTTGKFEVTDVSPVQGSREELLELAALGEHNSNHPIAQSVKQAYGKEADTGRIGRVEEISGHGIHAQVQINGEWKEIYIGNQKLMDRQGVTVSTPAAVLGTTLYLAEGTTYLGSIVISDSVRPDVPAMLAGLKKQGVSRLVMLTGDKEEVGKKVAESIGITHVFGNLLPGDKVAKVEQLLAEKPEGKTLAFVGDGINDAPVLARADVGIAMGGIGSDAAVEAADVVIMDDEPSKIVDAICIARKTVRIVKQNIIFAIVVKIAVLILVAFGCATMWAAVFGDVGVSVLAILNAIRALSYKK